MVIPRPVRIAGALMLAVAGATALDVMGQQRASPHDLRSAADRGRGEEAATCVFCHTPQGARRTASNPPRWLRYDGALPSFALYGVTALEVAEGNASMLCLSCHDASQAPGVDPLMSDHPIGMRYRGQDSGPALAAAPSELTLRRLSPPQPPAGARASGGFHAAQGARVDDRAVWWVATSTSARRTRSDLPLFSRAPLENEATVECATCHDPHNTQPMFLRVANEGSRLCLSCHDV